MGFDPPLDFFFFVNIIAYWWRSIPMTYAASDTADALKSVMRQIASSVAIITASGADGPVGITATSVTSVSMLPPSILVCINQATRLHQAVKHSDQFRVNYLAKGQQDIAKAFGGPIEGNRFKYGSWDTTASNGPRLLGCLGDMTCTVSGITDFGTHSVFIGLVSSVNVQNHDPLLYCGGVYATTQQFKTA